MDHRKERHAACSWAYQLVVFVAACAASRSAQAQVTFDWASIGDIGNAADTLTMTKCPSTFCTGDGTSGYGSVDYEYEITTTHVTATQYAEFLNAVDPDGTNSLGLFDSRMETFFHPVSFLPKDAYSGALTFDAGSAAGTKYGTKAGQESFPATWVSWVSAARFVNWLSNGQGAGETESGVYSNLPVTTSDPMPAREPGSTIFLPTDDEFYKAAYYDPTLNGGTGGYTEYGVGNAAPVVEGPSGGATSANYAQTDGVDGPSGDTYWQNGGAFDDDLVHLTPVGSYSSATSHYGLYDVDGNSYQWLENSRPNPFNTAQDLPLFRGGSWFNGADGSGAAYRNTQFFAAGSSSLSSNYHGIRIARLAQAEVLAGDFNNDGVVNAADYTAWRDNVNAPAGTLPNDPVGGVIGQGQYSAWVANFGATLPTASITIPEPAAGLLVAGLLIGLGLRDRPSK